MRMCVCVCVYIFCVVMLEPLSTLCVSFWVGGDGGGGGRELITFSISVYIMCVILCLFSALSHKVGALQISIIINTLKCNSEEN